MAPGPEVKVYFEGAIFGQKNMRTLADQATHAAGRMLGRYAGRVDWPMNSGCSWAPKGS